MSTRKDHESVTPNKAFKMKDAVSVLPSDPVSFRPLLLREPIVQIPQFPKKERIKNGNAVNSDPVYTSGKRTRSLASPASLLWFPGVWGRVVGTTSSSFLIHRLILVVRQRNLPSDDAGTSNTIWIRDSDSISSLSHFRGVSSKDEIRWSKH